MPGVVISRELRPEQQCTSTGPVQDLAQPRKITRREADVGVSKQQPARPGRARAIFSRNRQGFVAVENQCAIWAASANDRDGVVIAIVDYDELGFGRIEARNVSIFAASLRVGTTMVRSDSTRIP